MTKHTTKSRKSAPSSVDFQYSSDRILTKGIIPMVNEMAELLPDEMKPHGREIAGTLNISVLAIIAIFMVGAAVATLTGHSDQIMNIFAADIAGVGTLAVGKIAYTVKKTL
jgi:hypothetical protein